MPSSASESSAKSHLKAAESPANVFAGNYDTIAGAEFGEPREAERFTAGSSLSRGPLKRENSDLRRAADRFGGTDDPSDFNTGAGDFNIGRTRVPASMKEKIRGNAEKLAGKGAPPSNPSPSPTHTPPPASIATHLSLPSLRALTHLSLSLLSFPAPALTDFFAGITQGTLLPELEVLLLHNAARCIETQRVADIVERRWRWQGGLSRIRHFEIGFRGKDVLEELPGVVEWMVRAGLKVKIEKI
ncbi:hypothetical protein HMN09_00988600 [Mycena chlorophos]|uniref:Uncharacterized protein n=1 Tax=Mycena chlorophos TaxID=658473 RepID=A0A8H6VZE2_MYCCL|nr:hypothetical protein HMN09_00988600 [Mycena chlorophos]